MAVLLSRFFDLPQTGIAIGNLDEGAIITLNENASPVEFYLAKQDYESGLNGAGRTLVVRKDCYNRRQWNTSNVNTWATCSMRSWLNGTYKNMLDADIQSLMGTTTYHYTPGNGNNTVTTRSDSVFLLSATELGKSDSRFNAEGSALPIASTLQVAHLNGSATLQWTRSPATNDTGIVAYLYGNGSASAGSASSDIVGSRPCFTLPATFKLSDSQIIA